MPEQDDIDTELYDDNYYVVDIEYLEGSEPSTERDLNPRAMEVSWTDNIINTIQRMLRRR